VYPSVSAAVNRRGGETDLRALPEHSRSIERISSVNLGEPGVAGGGMGPILRNGENDKAPTM
jgi:hypothetical protein